MAEIVIFEKDLDLADNICEMLKYGNFNPVVLKSLPEGIKIPSHHPSLLIVGFEDRNDHAFLAKIDQLCAHYHCPLIILSPGLLGPNEIEQCNCKLKKEIVNKPFTFRSLHSAVLKLLKETSTDTPALVN
ncbi:hypothetical protein Echvi_3938 [Echinicola vietnamensis DSM 17526]|uniref:Response regulatory domain-containing protein n=1 Tax=Echinicola vietnamensis (strain DSM 17526 / LMG 23754 / KMM 6221) TaxID=926556 RepID=L0G4B5_ECHVK|nr:hypothetical protein Echvi_3938 [Echinicola vietnamensis DSM 17526]